MPSRLDLSLMVRVVSLVQEQLANPHIEKLYLRFVLSCTLYDSFCKVLCYTSEHDMPLTQPNTTYLAPLPKS